MKRPPIVILAVLLFALSLPMAAARVASSFQSVSAQAAYVAWLLLAVNAVVAVWLFAFPRTARIPTLFGLCFKLIGGAASIYYAAVGTDAKVISSGLVLAVVSFALVLYVSIGFVFGVESRRYFSTLRSNT